MRKIWIVVLALSALGSVLANSAFAETTALAEWLTNGNKIAAGLAGETTGEFLLEDNKTSFGASSILCSVILTETVGPGGSDKITEVHNLAGENSV